MALQCRSFSHTCSWCTSGLKTHPEKQKFPSLFSAFVRGSLLSPVTRCSFSSTRWGLETMPWLRWKHWKSAANFLYVAVCMWWPFSRGRGVGTTCRDDTHIIIRTVLTCYQPPFLPVFTKYGPIVAPENHTLDFLNRQKKGRSSYGNV